MCVEPWTRPDNALNDPDQALWIEPGESISLPIILSVKEVNKDTDVSQPVVAKL